MAFDLADTHHVRSKVRQIKYKLLQSNNRRLLEPIGNVPRAEAEERYYAQLEDINRRRNSN
jgi:hypothetical protein